MALSDLKITSEKIQQNGLVAAPDKLTGTAAENKALFDKLVREIVKVQLNNLVDALMAYTGADEIGAQMNGADTTIQGALNTLKAEQDAEAEALEAAKTELQGSIDALATKEQEDYDYLDEKLDMVSGDLLNKIFERYTKREVDEMFIEAAAEVNSLVADISYSDYKMTVTAKDGTVTEVDLDALKPSQTLKWTGDIYLTEGNDGKVGFWIQDGSIVMKKLAASLQETINGKQEALVSGENIKTVNGESLLGSGDIAIESGGSDLPTVDSTNNGQVLKVVDGAWAAGEDEVGGGASSWNDLTDKPFGEETTVYYEKDVTPILETVTVAEGQYFHKFSDTPMTAEELIRCMLVINTNGEESTGEITEDILQDAGTFIAASGVMSVLEETTMDGITLAVGMWAAEAEEVNVIRLYKEEIIKIPEKYLPETSGGGVSIVDSNTIDVTETAGVYTAEIKDNAVGMSKFATELKTTEAVVYYTYADNYVPLEKVATGSDYWYKVQEEALSYNEMIGMKVTVKGAATLTFTLAADNLTDGGTYVKHTYAVSVLSASTVDGASLSAGLWFKYGTSIKVTKATKDVSKIKASAIAGGVLPEVTASDNGKLLQVVDGVWAAVAITNGNEVAY